MVCARVVVETVASLGDVDSARGFAQGDVKGRASDDGRMQVGTSYVHVMASPYVDSDPHWSYVTGGAGHFDMTVTVKSFGMSRAQWGWAMDYRPVSRRT